MRATTTLAVSSLTLLLAGCSGGVRIATVPVSCTPTTSIAVTYTAVEDGPITPVPECISVAPGDIVTLTFSPTPALNAASTRYRLILGAGWMRAKNDDPMHPERIVLDPAPDNGDDEDRRPKDYKYIIKIKDVGKLDPRIVVE